MPLPLIPLVALGVAAVGGAVAVWRLTRPALDATPAPPGTPRIDARLPVALWPPDGHEPTVEDDPRGWERMLAHLAHRDTVPDGAERARAVAFAGHRRSELDARRSVALEAHLLRGGYDPDVIAAAWLYPSRPGSPATPARLRAFGIPGPALAITEAASGLERDDARVGEARRRLAVDPVRPDFGDAAFEALPAEDRPVLAALLLDAAAEHVAVRRT
ncbi:MAG TPA: hypothetical protein VNR36_00875 [Pseudolysinimonas sp.]|nr:hypothetical protein [Pseudolysinimonas sp.]